MKNKLIYILLILLLAPILLSGCENTAEQQQEEEDHTSFLATYSDEGVKRTLLYFDETYNELKAAVDSATAETAATTREGITALEANLDKFDNELAKAVEDSKITQDVKKGYDQSIEDLRTKVNTLNTTLEEKGL